MIMSNLSSPVAYIVFNRPRHTRETFAAIRKQKPVQLFIIADGPRQGHPEDVERCREVREVVALIDWPCEVHRNYSDNNLGCKHSVSSGLNWVFSRVDRAIILEDDCLASPDFFSFCNTLLEFYKNNERVWTVAGNSYQPEHQRGDGSYYFSKYPNCWGWATWRRAWQHYRGDMPFLKEWKKSPRWRECFPVRAEQRYWNRIFRLCQQGKIDTWDFPWIACAMYGGGLTATPNANLVKNIGFDAEGTHTTGLDDGFTYDITPLGSIVYPSEIKADVQADEFYRLRFFVSQDSLWQRLLGKLKRSITMMLWSSHAKPT
jgi:hypothetical protein